MLTKNESEERHMSYVLDSVDRQIIRMLQHDGRASNVKIAHQVGVSEATVRKRLDRLVVAGIIRIIAVPDAVRTGFSTIAFMTLSVDLAQVGQIAIQIARLPAVRSIHLTAGGSELIVEAWFTSSDELLQSMTEQFGSIPGIRRIATSHVLKTIKDGRAWLLPVTTSPDSGSGLESGPG